MVIANHFFFIMMPVKFINIFETDISTFPAMQQYIFYSVIYQMLTGKLAVLCYKIVPFHISKCDQFLNEHCIVLL